jgi:proteasome activator-like protein
MAQEPQPSSSAPPGPQAVAVDPQKLLRIAGVTREVLEEARRIRPEPGAVDHLRRVHAQICDELQGALPPDLWKELDELTPDIKDGTLEELSLAHSEILGWLEGLFQGTHLALQAQAAQAAQMLRQQMGEAGGRGLGSGDEPETDGGTPGGTSQYL